jgi:hypothetical protein
MSTTITDTSTTDEAAEHCGQCGVPVERNQRYCLNCGQHRRRAHDPVAAYLSEASAARTRVAAAEALAAQRRPRPRFGSRLVALLVAAALLVGIVIGNATAGSSGSGHAPTGQRSTQRHTATSVVKNATGKSYLQQEEHLPSTVTP